MRLHLIGGLLVLLSVCSLAQDRGVISGSVTDKSGNLISDAEVTATPVAVVHIGILPQTRTDSSGFFKFELPYGRYRVTAAKESENYPQMHHGLYGGNSEQLEVVLSGTSQTADVKVVLRYKAAVVAGTVANAETGAPVNANATIVCTTDKRRILSGSGLTNSSFRLLVPSDCPVKLTVFQDGYTPWTYTSNGGEASLRLEPDEVLSVDIKLHKAAEKRTPPSNER